MLDVMLHDRLHVHVPPPLVHRILDLDRYINAYWTRLWSPVFYVELGPLGTILDIPLWSECDYHGSSQLPLGSSC